MKKFLNKNKTTLTLFGAGVSSLVASYLSKRRKKTTESSAPGMNFAKRKRFFKKK